MLIDEHSNGSPSSQHLNGPLFYYVGIQFYDGKRLGGIEANLIDDHPLKNMYWKDRPRSGGPPP